jgi:ribose transport system permease protein
MRSTPVATTASGADMGPLLRRSLADNPTEWLMTVALVVMCLVLTVTAPYFATPGNAINILTQAAAVGIVALGQTLVILEGGIDLSVGSVYGLSGVAGALVMVNFGMWPGIGAALLVGAGVGLLNGVLISYLRLAPFMVTLAFLSIARSWDYVITNSTSVTGLPQEFSFLGTGSIAGVPFFVILMVAIYAIGHVVASRARLGRYIYAIGNNAEAARLAGVNVRLYRVVPYAVIGILAAVAALVSTSRLLSIDPNAGAGLELNTIAAVVIGGTSLFGGKGTIIGTAMGTLFVTVLTNGLNLMNVSPYWQGTAIGLVILIAIGLPPTIRAARDLMRARSRGKRVTQG